MKISQLIVINHFVIIINFCIRFDKGLTKIFLFRSALSRGQPVVRGADFGNHWANRMTLFWLISDPLPPL
jgi:hypothetical protein